MSVNYRQIVDVMRKTNLARERLTSKEAFRKVTREEILDLEYREGEEVIDSVTGERGRVIAGTTTYITKVPGA